MSGPLILAIDQGTTNTKAVLLAADGRVMQSRSRALRLSFPQPGWAEQSAAEIRETVAALIAEVATPGIVAVAIANQRETVVIWDAASGQPVTSAVSWQCQRSAARCRELQHRGVADEVVRRSGLGLDPMFPAAKLAVLLDSLPGGRERAARGELRCGTIDSWLLWNLTGGAVHATDHSNASRTQLFSLDTLQWDAELARIFDVPLAMLPAIMPSDSQFGMVAPGYGLPPGTPIHAMLGDSHAALFAHGIESPGAVKATIGTGSSLMTPTQGRVQSTHGLSGTIAWSRRGQVQHALEGNISVSGHAAAFATALLGLADEDALTALAATVPDSGGVTFVPALAGLGAPYWRPQARGTIHGMTLGTQPAHVARATLEAIAHQIGDVLDAMDADLGTRTTSLSIDGGAAGNVVLAQLLADLTGRTIRRPQAAGASALGVARMAIRALGLDDGGLRLRADDSFVPTLPDATRQAIRRDWHAAVDRASA
ncbi:glycerol kinase [Croceibacterium mercuriale]|uniref:ATP:glycerol 3-phosphotransferase n=1 Tax=Croceibacterium mercuriale TaxID=1572751 RepID=A0A0B2BZR8_9SPHN|nr:FGGY family carbohydrate kinase [Croceibacterium mercuriale]KHL25527.1 glycerol kinase [Croceibacterium mercuriale]